MTGGDGRLSIPPYGTSTPAVVNVTCVCGRWYAVITDEPDAGGAQLLERAGAQGVMVVDARREPFKRCACDEALDFTTEAVGALM